MSSPAKICMNGLCGATTTPQWKNGWPMKTGGFATLCYACGTAYDNIRYCERFHLNEQGWRECNSCEKPIHCGCVVSKYLHEYVDQGGILCINCIRSKGTQTLKLSIVNEIPNGFARFSSDWHPSIFSNRTNNDKGSNSIPTVDLNMSSSFRSPLSLASFFPNPLPLAAIPGNNKPDLGSNLIPQSLGFSSGTSNGVAEAVRVQEKVPSFKQDQKPRQMLPKPPKSGVSIRTPPNKGMGSDNRATRPPAEGRGRSQLLPRYWPKITDQELLQISGDLNSNSTITPLFEKVLSASDAGRIGRLVLPKACAEAYFPPIHFSEGLPINIRDIKGKEWTFQFRFWPNNNSRMYVLEGVTPCIQNMQLQAGDTVIFSRLDPDDKLVIGCRKATISAEASSLSNAVNDGALICATEGTTNWDSQRPVSQEKKKARNIGSKSKRLHMHSEDAMELKFTWEEAQEFLRPPPSKPTVVVIENCELEEYDQPPVFGKKTIFTTNASRLQEQWVQCDSCSKWRRLPSDVLIPAKWTCSDNVSDPSRCSCLAPEESGVKDLDRILRLGKESKKRKLAETWVSEEQQPEPTGLDALATLAVLGANDSEIGDSSVGPTTRHPRHRPGCTCIVCIQPPSGKGKHKPNCICNVCATVRRRFKTLMLRKRKRLLARDGETVQKPLGPIINEPESGDGLGTKTGQELDLNCDPKEEEMMLAEAASGSGIPPEWQNVLAGLVPNGTSDVSKDVEGS